MRTRLLLLSLALGAFLLVASLAAFQSAPAPRSGFLDVLRVGTKLQLQQDGDGLFPGLGTHEVLEVGPDWFSCGFVGNVPGMPVTRIPQTAIRSIQIYPPSTK
jgi:hypothetical protein